jgi:hypothetical protein
MSAMTPRLEVGFRHIVSKQNAGNTLKKLLPLQTKNTNNTLIYFQHLSRRQEDTHKGKRAENVKRNYGKVQEERARTTSHRGYE